MSTKPYPDPNCDGPHKPRQRLVRWMHTADCLEAHAHKFKIEPEDSGTPPNEATIVERARAVGAL